MRTVCVGVPPSGGVDVAPPEGGTPTQTTNAREPDEFPPRVRSGSIAATPPHPDRESGMTRLTSFLLLGAALAVAQQPPSLRDRLPRLKPTEPADVAKSFRV